MTYRLGCLGVPTIIVAFPRLRGSIQSFLHRGLAKAFVPGIDDRLIADKRQIGFGAGQRKYSGLSRQHLAAYGKISVLDPMKEFLPLLEIFCLDGSAETLGRVGLLRARG